MDDIDHKEPERDHGEQQVGAVGEPACQFPDQRGLRWTMIDRMVVQYIKASIQQQQQQP